MSDTKGAQRYDLNTNYRCGDAIEEMEKADDGEWIRYEDVEATIQRLEQASAWLPISTAPKDGTEVIVFHEGAIFTSYYDAEDGPGWWHDHGRVDPAPSHWQPLPSPPKEGQ